jgi:hypothetical protein
MEKAEKFSGVNFLKTPSGDAMMLVHIDRESLKVFMEKGAAIAIDPHVEAITKGCQVRYDKFIIKSDLVIQPY